MPLILQGATSGQATLQATDAQTVTITMPATSGTLVTTGGAQTIEFADGSASAPSITNSGDTNTGMFFPAADTIAFTEGGTESMRIDSSGNVGIGTTGPVAKLDVSGGFLRINEDGIGTKVITIRSNFAGVDPAINVTTNNALLFQTNNTERMRITSGGVFLVGNTDGVGSGSKGFEVAPSGTVQIKRDTTSAASQIVFYNPNGFVGQILTTGTTTTYSTTSDHRLKENVAPMTGALAKVQELNPVTYNWKVDGSNGQGFIAHELQAIVPDCVTGTKDGMRTEKYEVSPAIPATFDEEGNELTPAVEAVMGEREVPDYQGIDTSFLVATLTAAIQELKATVDAQAARIAALEGAK